MIPFKLVAIINVHQVRCKMIPTDDAMATLYVLGLVCYEPNISIFNQMRNERLLLQTHMMPQRAKKVVSDCPGLVDFAIGLVDSDHHLPDRQVKFSWELKLQNYCKKYLFNFQVDLWEPKAVFQADLTKGNLLKKVSHYISRPK